MIKIKKPSIKKLKWGIAGCGRYAELTFIPAIMHLRKSVIIAVFSKDELRAKNVAEKAGVTHIFNNFDKFLQSDIDAVYISSANYNHFEQVIKAAKAGKHILCEKPVAMNAVEAEEMVRVCKENNVRFAVNYVYRFHPLISKAKELIEDEIIGKIVSLNVNFNIDFPPGSNFRFNKELSGGGALRDLGTHMIDLLRYFGGEIISISGFIDSIIYKSEVEDFAAGIVKFQKSGYGIFNVSFNNKKGFNRIEILGHKGAIGIENLIGVKNASAKMSILLDGEARKSFRKRGNKLLYLLKDVQKAFLKNEEPSVTGYDGYVNMKLMEELESKCQNGIS